MIGDNANMRSRRSRRVRCVGLALGLCIALATGAQAKTPAVLKLSGTGDLVQQLELEQGKSMLLQPAYDVQRVSVGDPSVADVVVIGSRELQLVARDLGETNVVLWDGGGRPRAAIDLSVARPHAGIERELRRVTGNDEIQIERVGESIVLKGTVSSTVAADRALRVANAFFPGEDGSDKIINLLEVGGNHQVMIEVTMAEMSRRVTRKMESNFTAMGTSGGGQFRVFNFLDQLVGLDDSLSTADAVVLADQVNLVAGFSGFGTTSFTSYLNFLQQKGLVRVLAEPTLLARSGQSASFLAGGEVPIPIAQGGAFGSITIEFKQFGVLVDFTPTVLGPDRIHMEISPEVSEPDFTIGTSVDGTMVPGFRTRRASTGVELADGQSFAIAGLLSEDIREQASQYPLLGDIPVLGMLFRSKKYQKDETEMVLLVRPRLVKPLTEGRPPLPGDYFVEPSDYEFYLTNALEGAASESPATSSIGASGGLLGAVGHRISVGEAEKELQ